jgi:ribosomal protein S18 acetylase RimI-like enzyme
MGLTPAARGRGWGHELTRHAFSLAQAAGRRQLVLAVDANNAPALKTYAAAGFAAWDRRSVFLRMTGAPNYSGRLF